MAEEFRKRPRLDPDDDDTPYRLRDDEDDAPPVAPRPRPARRRDDDEDEIRLRRPRRPRTASAATMDAWVRVMIGGAVVLLVLIGLALFGVWYWMRTAQSSPFNANMSAYLSAPVRAAPGNASRVVMGKMVVVDTSKKDVDWDVFFALPDDLRATKPTEVGTIVWVAWGKTQVQPGYDNGASAYIQTCHLTVIDRKSRTMLWEQQYQGSEPPSSIDSSASEGVGSKPTDQVLDFLKGLPRG